MQRLVAVATIVALGTAAFAEPTPPDVDPVHAQREDAQRLSQQHHELLVSPAPPSPATTQLPPPPAMETKRGQRIAGFALLGSGALVALVALPPALDTPSTSSSPSSSSSGAATLVLVGGAATAVVGALLIFTSRSVRAAPTVGSHAVGLAISGRL